MDSESVDPKAAGAATRASVRKRCPAYAAKKLIPTEPFCLDCVERLPPGLLESVTDRETEMESFAPAMEVLRKLLRRL